MAKKYLLKASNVSVYVGSGTDLATATWTELPEVYNMEKGSTDVETVDVTSFSSEGDFREELNSFKSFTEGTIEFYELLGDTTQALVTAALGALDPIAIRIEKSDGTKTKTIDALFNVTGESEPLAPGDAASLSYTIKRTGSPVVNVADNT